MKTTNTTETQEKKEFDLEECFVLWKQTSKKGKPYLTGATSSKEVEESTKLIGFYSTKKENPNEADIKVYVREKVEEGEEPKRGILVANLWEKQSQNFNLYLSGETNENEGLVGFYVKEKKNDKAPDIRVYYSKDKK